MSKRLYIFNSNDLNNKPFFLFKKRFGKGLKRSFKMTLKESCKNSN
jgi:hypothetical protein